MLKNYNKHVLRSVDYWRMINSQRTNETVHVMNRDKYYCFFLYDKLFFTYVINRFGLLIIQIYRVDPDREGFFLLSVIFLQ